MPVAMATSTTTAAACPVAVRSFSSSSYTARSSLAARTIRSPNDVAIAPPCNRPYPTLESAHGLRTDRAAGDDPQGSGDARALVLARLLAGAGSQARVPVGLRQGVRQGGLARRDHPRGVRRLRARRDGGGHPAAR